MKDTPPEQLTLARFAEALHTTFRVQPDVGTSVELRLIEATEGRVGAAGDGAESFSIIFNGPGDGQLPQRMYSIEHDAMGRFDLFIVAVGQNEAGIQYQAIFNRLAGAS